MFSGGDVDQKRKHRATGKKPPGGTRYGAGRPSGPQVLSNAEVQAVHAAKLRVPAGAAQVAKDLAAESLVTMANVMRGGVSFVEAPVRLKAAAMLREEVCGVQARPVHVAGADGGPLQVSIQINRTVVKPGGEQ